MTTEDSAQQIPDLRPDDVDDTDGANVTDGANAEQGTEHDTTSGGQDEQGQSGPTISGNTHDEDAAADNTLSDNSSRFGLGGSGS